MRIFGSILIIILSAGCASTNVRVNSELSLKQVLNLKVDEVRSLEVSRTIGEPTTKHSSEEQETWSYTDKKTAKQRLVLTFLLSNGLLKSILWIPNSTETEYNLENVISRFPKLKPDPVDESKINPHSPVGDVVYRDEAAGQVVLANEAREKIIALAWYSRDTRNVTGTTDSKNIPYTIGK